MTYYFMPRVPGLASDVTLFNRPSRGSTTVSQSPQIVHVAWCDGTRWRIEEIADLPATASIRVDETMLPAGCSEDMLAVLFLSPERYAGDHVRLPPLGHMETVPAWRANIRLRSGSTSVSYQGEYPTGMAAANGTLLSLTPLIQSDPAITNTVLFVNVCAVASSEPHELCIHSAASGRLIRRATVRRNRCTAIPLPAPDPGDRLSVLSCRDITGVPLYLAHDRNFRHMSLEHSHPPMEMVAFGARASVNHALKNAWFARIEP